MRKGTSLLLALLLLAFSGAAQMEDFLPAQITGPENLVPLGQAVIASVVTVHGSQYSITLRLEEIRFEGHGLIAFFALKQGEILAADRAHTDYLEQRFGSGENIFPAEQMLLHPDAFTLITDEEEEYPFNPDGFSLVDGEEFEYEPLAMVPGEEIHFMMVFDYVNNIHGARIRFQDTGMYQVFQMRPDLMVNGIAWLALE